MLPALPPGSSPPSVMTLGMGTGVQTASSDGPAQPLYFFLQCDGGCQGPSVGLSCSSKFIIGQGAQPTLHGVLPHIR